MSFDQLNLSEHILRALKDLNYISPTPIQAKAIPEVLNRHDLMACAQTGTGKTAAFALPIIELIQRKDQHHKEHPVLRSLVVTPTRELAIQIEESFRDYGKYTFLRYAVVYGGVNQNRQVEKIKKGINVLVATPGRLLDLIDQGFISLDEVRLFVLDEADRMLDMGFIHDINKIIALLPKKRQSLFFSATMPPNIVKLSRKILKDPKKVEATPEATTAETVQQKLYYTNKRDKKELLLHILKNELEGSVLVFTRTKHGADRLTKNLNRAGIKAGTIHGDKAQNSRQKALNMFKDRKLRVLVATDIAARGIDVDKLQLVINYEIPNIPETYVHRIGRSGRAGEEGLAISLCDAEERAYIRDIQRLIGNTIPEVKDHPFPQTDKPMTEAEKKEFEREKKERKKAYFEEKRKREEGRGGRSKSRSKKKDSRSSGKRNDRQAASNKTESKDSGRDEQQRKKNDQDSSSRSDNRGRRDNKKSNDRKPRSNNKGKEERDSRGKRKLPETLSKKYRWPLE